MTIEFKFPDVGEGITEGEIVEWKVSEGDAVKEDDTLLAVETAKAVVDIPSPADGTIKEIRVKEGTINVGQVLVVINDTKKAKQQGIVGDYSKKEEPKKSKKKVSVLKKGSQPTDNQQVKATQEKPKISSQEKPQTLIKQSQTALQMPKKILATPKIRHLAKQMGINIELIQGTGIGHRVTEDDLKRFKEKPTPRPPTESTETKQSDYGEGDHIPLKGLRKAITKNLTVAWQTIPHVTHTDSVDVTDLVKLREKEKKKLAKKDIHLTYLPFIIKAIVRALKDHPYLNAVLNAENEQIILKKYYNIGMAVDTPDGLMVPVIKEADRKSIIDLAKDIARLADQARTRKIQIADLRGATFTFTNIGSYGGLMATPIINPPEVANLGIMRIQDEPKVIKGKIKPRKILYLSLSFDHRVVDGAEAAKFVNTIKEHLEDPDLLLMD